MPHPWNKILVVTKDELVPDFYNWNTLKNTIRNYSKKTYGIKRVQIGGNGRPMLIDYDSLPPEIQNAIPDPRKVDHLLLKYYKVDGEAVTFYTTYNFDGKGYLKEEHQERYIINASVLKAAIQLNEERIFIRQTMKGSLKGKKGVNGKSATLSIGETLHNDVQSFNNALKIKFDVTHTLPASEKHFKRVLKEFETNGYVTLISDKHFNTNSRKVTDDVLNLLESMFAGNKTKPTKTEVYRKYDAFMGGYLEVITTDGEVLNPSDFEAISERTITGYLSKWKSKIGTYAKRSGNRQVLIGQFTPPHSMKKGMYAGSIISIDDRQPPFKMPNGDRVWFYMAKDLASDAFTCWVHGVSKEGIILEFYRQLVRNYTEWGLCLPIELEAEMSLNSSFKETFLREGVMFKHVRIEANRARTKRVERDNKELRYNYEKGEEGWLARPHAREEANQAGPGEVKAVPYEQIIETCLGKIQEWNNKPHVKHPDKSRWRVFMENQHPDVTPINYGAILPYIGYKTTTSCNVGIIRLNYGEYLLGVDGNVALGSKLIPLMEKVEGQEVDIWWLDDNAGEVLKAMVYMDGQLICEAVPKPTYYRAKAELGEDYAKARTIMSAYVSSIESFGKRRRQAIAPVLLIDRSEPLFNDFVMPGLKKHHPKKESGGVLPDLPEDDFDLIPTQTFRRDLRDRF